MTDNSTTGRRAPRALPAFLISLVVSTVFVTAARGVGEDARHGSGAAAAEPSTTASPAPQLPPAHGEEPAGTPR